MQMSKKLRTLILTPMIMFYSQAQAGQSFDDSDISRSSADNREEMKFGVGLNGGLFMGILSGGGLNLHYNSTDSLQFEFMLTQGELDAKDWLNEENYDVLNLDYFDVDASIYQVRAKYFVGNSFYFAGGLGQRQVDFDLAATSSAETLKVKTESSSTILSLSLGNIWTFDSGFYLGGEWLAVAVPISSSSKSDATHNGLRSSESMELQRDSKEVADDLSKATTAGLAMLMVGWQF